MTHFTIEELHNQAAQLRDAKEHEQALQVYDAIVAIAPEDAFAWSNRATPLRAMGRLPDALFSCDQALLLNTLDADTWINRGNVLQEMGQALDAIASYEKALSIHPDDVDAWLYKGHVFSTVKDYARAVLNYEEVLKRVPNHGVALLHHGNALAQLHDFEKALVSYDRLVLINTDDASIWINRAVILRKLDRLPQALISYNRALSIRYHVFDACNRLHLKMQMCDWSDFNAEVAVLCDAAYAGALTAPSFTFVSLVNDPALQKHFALTFVDHHAAYKPILPLPTWLYQHKKIRIGYFSADFYSHATAQLMVELFEKHDKSQFEIFAFSLNAPVKDAMRLRLEQAFDHFIDVDTLSDQQVAQLSRECEIDIAIDLKGFTQNARPDIFAMRAAPIQVNYLGYPATMGASYIDYLIADPVVIPPDHQQYYTEKIAYLPDSYQVNSSLDVGARHAVKLTRGECGLPEEVFVFCSFNNNYKITPIIFDSWMRILALVSHSVLWLFVNNDAAQDNLREEARLRGISPDRLVFARPVEMAIHLARYCLVDLFLDTVPYNAHTTASDALRMGLPVLTIMQETFASRVAASLLTALDMPELITHTHAEYEKCAVMLANDQQKLGQVKQKLSKNLPCSPLFNSSLFTEHLEKIYIKMTKRYHSGEQACTIFIDS